MNANIKDIKIKNKKMDSITYSTKNGEKTVNPDYLISTIHLKDFLEYFNPGVPKKIKDASNKLRFRGLIVFYAFVDKKRVMRDNWKFFPEKDYIFNRVSELNSFNPNIAPEGKSVIVAEVSTKINSKLDYMKDDKLAEKILTDLEKAEILTKKEVKSYLIKKAKRIYPIYSLDYKKHLQNITEYVFEIDGLYTLGRQGLFNYNNIDHSIDMSLNIVKHLVSKGTGRDWKVVLKRFDEYKIVD